MSSPISYSGNAVCSIGVKDHRASADWYIRVLGCTLMFDSDEAGMSYLSTPVEKLYLDLSQVETPILGGGATLVWGVTDIDGSRKFLEDQDVRFDGPTRQLGQMVRLATFFDPDGNTLMLYQSLSSN